MAGISPIVWEAHYHRWVSVLPFPRYLHRCGIGNDTFANQRPRPLQTSETESRQPRPLQVLAYPSRFQGFYTGLLAHKFTTRIYTNVLIYYTIHANMQTFLSIIIPSMLQFAGLQSCLTSGLKGQGTSLTTQSAIIPEAVAIRMFRRYALGKVWIMYVQESWHRPATESRNKHTTTRVARLAGHGMAGKDNDNDMHACIYSYRPFSYYTW